MANNTNCEPCNITATVPVAPPPVCPVPACEELVPTECVVNNLLNDGCTSQFYQYDQEGALVIQNGVPVPQVPPIPLGLTISQGQSLHTILTNLVDAQNCKFEPNVIAGMLQVIQANPNHPVAQIFCNLVCSCQPCDVPCSEDLTVEEVVFNPGLTNVQFTFYAQAGISYDFNFVNTSVTPPSTVTYTGWTPLPSQSSNPSGVTLNTNGAVNPATNNTLGLTLTEGSSYQLFIRAYNNEAESCPNGSWYFQTDQSPSCDCDEIIIDLQFEPGISDCIDFDIVLSIAAGQTIPEGYNITITQGTVSPVTVYGPAFTPIAVPGPDTPFSYGCSGGLVNDTYTVYVEPVCTQLPPCIGTEIFETIEITGVVVCDPPIITGVTIA